MVAYAPVKRHYSMSQLERKIRAMAVRVYESQDGDEEPIRKKGGYKHSTRIDVGYRDQISTMTEPSPISEVHRSRHAGQYLTPGKQEQSWKGWRVKIEGKPIISIVMTKDGHSSHRISAKHNKNIASFFIMRSKLYYLTANRHLFSVDLDYLTSAKDGRPATVEQEFAGNIIFDVIGNKKLLKLCWTDGQKVYVQNDILYENELNPMIII